MNAEASPQKKRKGYITSSDLVLIALATAFFPRVLMMLKAPSLVNFFHFAAVPFACAVVLTKARSRDRRQILLSQEILFALIVLLTIGFASALLNGAGAINVVLSFLLLGEPFMLILAIVTIPMSPARVERFRGWVLGFGFFNLVLALIQRFFLRWDVSGRSPCSGLDGVDTITGVFICQGAGVIVSASVSLALAAYFLVYQKNSPLWLRVLPAIGCFVQIITADAKQVLFVGGVAFGLMSLTNIKDLRKTISIVITMIVVFQVFWWAIFHLEFLENFAGWIRPELYGPDGEATRFKMFGINAILNHMHSPLNQLFGLGPGHTIDRLGMMMLRDYSNLLNPLGATRTTLSDEVWSNIASSWLANGTTMFSPFFSCAAIWGDLGILGLSAYFYLYFLIWRYIATDDLSKFQMLSVFVVGFIQCGMQEPGFMLFVASLLGLRWQEIRYKTR